MHIARQRRHKDLRAHQALAATREEEVRHLRWPSITNTARFSLSFSERTTMYSKVSSRPSEESRGFPATDEQFGAVDELCL
jgi:hypothetical protein